MKKKYWIYTITNEQQLQILRNISKSVTTNDIKTKKYKTLISSLLERVEINDEGKITLGIAAPQLWENVRIIVVKDILRVSWEWNILQYKNIVMINPEITSISSQTNLDYEGCLSVPDIEDYVERSNTCTITYVNIDGSKQIRTFEWLNARVVLHEIDHLNWVLFIDYKKVE